MPKRIVVRVNPEAVPSLDALADRLASRLDMRVGLRIPRYGFIVGEVPGQAEIDRIAGLPEVGGVRVSAQPAGTGHRRRGPHTLQ